MPYRLVKGQFRLHYRTQRHVGSRPDGDSMWFLPNNPAHLERLGDRQVEYNKGGFVQLRFEGIDALELHYKGANHQKLPECINARNHLLQQAGFTNVVYAPSASGVDTSVRSSTPTRIEGYILTRNADPYGRPVAFVFAGRIDRRANTEIWLDPPLMRNSLNATMIEDGHAYPTYYTGLPTDLRNELTNLATSARNNDLETWAVNSFMTFTRIRNNADLGVLAIWPKLYRRLFSYFATGNVRLSGFEQWLRQTPNKDDELWIISRAELGNMHDVFEVSRNRIRMTVNPEDIIIVPR